MTCPVAIKSNTSVSNPGGYLVIKWKFRHRPRQRRTQLLTEPKCSEKPLGHSDLRGTCGALNGWRRPGGMTTEEG